MEKHQLFSLKKRLKKNIIANYEVLFIFSTDRNRALLWQQIRIRKSKLFTMKTSQKTVKQVFQEIEKIVNT